MLPPPAQISLPPLDEYVDLTVTITQTDDKRHLNWTIIAWSLQRVESAQTQLDNAREFSAKLLRDLKTQKHKGLFAATILQNKGRDIAALMPPVFFEMLKSVQQSLNRPLLLLLITDETYIPWELALLETPLDAALPNAFLATQTHMGRWIKNSAVKTPPPGRISLRKFTVVASKYGPSSSLPELKEAIAEQDALRNYFAGLGASPVIKEATNADLQTVIFAPQRTPGHLIHFAVHGMSDPDANDQALLLADRTRTELPPSALIPPAHPGETPLFSFVFLNACQVGTAGSSLGQAAGFPGDVMRGGTLGFIAPLWEVHDTPARELAEAFYKATLGKAQSAAEFLQICRKRYDPNGSTTPMAYIYYGHPLLKLKFVKLEEVCDDSTD